MSFRKPCHMPFHKLIPPFTLTEFYFIFTSLSPLNILNCYIAGNLFLTVRTLIGYFEVTSHLTMKLFPAKISERATLRNVRGNNALLLVNVDRRLLLQRGLKNVFQLQHFQPYNRSLKDCSLEKQ